MLTAYQDTILENLVHDAEQAAARLVDSTPSRGHSSSACTSDVESALKKYAKLAKPLSCMVQDERTSVYATQPSVLEPRTEPFPNLLPDTTAFAAQDGLPAEQFVARDPNFEQGRFVAERAIVSALGAELRVKPPAPMPGRATIVAGPWVAAAVPAGSRSGAASPSFRMRSTSPGSVHSGITRTPLSTGTPSRPVHPGAATPPRHSIKSPAATPSVPLQAPRPAVATPSPQALGRWRSGRSVSPVPPRSPRPQAAAAVRLAQLR